MGEIEVEVIGGADDGRKVNALAPNPIEGDSWLNTPEYAAFRFAYGYASTQSGAIPGLSQITAEDAYLIHSALQRGEEHHQRQVDALLKELGELTKDLDRDELEDLLVSHRPTQQS